MLRLAVVISMGVALALAAAPARADDPALPRVPKSKLGFRLAVGAELALDGVGASAGLHPGFGLRLQRTTNERAALELTGAIGFPAEAGDDVVRWDVWRVPLALGVELALGKPRPRWRTSIAAHGGVVLYHLAPALTTGGAQAASGLSLAGRVGVRFRLRLSIASRSAIELDLGGDLVVAQPELAYVLGDVEHTAGRPWYPQPSAGIWLVTW